MRARQPRQPASQLRAQLSYPGGGRGMLPCNGACCPSLCNTRPCHQRCLLQTDPCIPARRPPLCAAGGWGKPPVDEAGRPVYGDVFGLEDEEVDEDEQVSCLLGLLGLPCRCGLLAADQ